MLWRPHTISDLACFLKHGVAPFVNDIDVIVSDYNQNEYQKARSSAQVFGKTKEEFKKLQRWRQIQAKKSTGLF